MQQQLGLFGRSEPVAFDATFSTMERVELGEGAWIDLARGWLAGHARLFEELLHGTAWRAEERVMYERRVDVPRLYAALPKGKRALPIIEDMRAALDSRYATRFDRTSFALYRDGSDSVAWHGDHVARRMQEALVATVSVGAPRKFLLRPKGGGASIAYSLGWGDLIVMGGTCQRTWDHAVPKVAHAEPRISIMLRPTFGDRR